MLLSAVSGRAFSAPSVNAAEIEVLVTFRGARCCAIPACFPPRADADLAATPGAFWRLAVVPLAWETESAAHGAPWR